MIIMVQNTPNVFNLNYHFNKVQFWVVDCRKSHVQKCCNAMGAQNYTQGITRVRDMISIRVLVQQLRPILTNFSRKFPKMMITCLKLDRESYDISDPPIHFKCAYILFGTCCKYNNLSRAHLFHVYQNSSSHTLMNFNSFSIQSYPLYKRPALIKSTRLVKKSDKFRVLRIGRQ